jgi:hypothetical protein
MKNQLSLPQPCKTVKGNMLVLLSGFLTFLRHGTPHVSFQEPGCYLG